MSIRKVLSAAGFLFVGVLGLGASQLLAGGSGGEWQTTGVCHCTTTIGTTTVTLPGTTVTEPGTTVTQPGETTVYTTTVQGEPVTTTVEAPPVTVTTPPSTVTVGGLTTVQEEPVTQTVTTTVTTPAPDPTPVTTTVTVPGPTRTIIKTKLKNVVHILVRWRTRYRFKVIHAKVCHCAPGFRMWHGTCHGIGYGKG